MNQEGKNHVLAQHLLARRQNPKKDQEITASRAMSRCKKCVQNQACASFKIIQKMILNTPAINRTDDPRRQGQRTATKCKKPPGMRQLHEKAKSEMIPNFVHPAINRSVVPRSQGQRTASRCKKNPDMRQHHEKGRSKTIS